MGKPKEEEEKGRRDLFKDILAEKFPTLRKELHIQVHDANMTSYYLNRKDLLYKHIILKPSKVNNKVF